MIEEGLEKQTKEMINVFNEIISENFPNLKNEMENQVKRLIGLQLHKITTHPHQDTL